MPILIVRHCFRQFTRLLLLNQTTSALVYDSLYLCRLFLQHSFFVFNFPFFYLLYLLFHLPLFPPLSSTFFQYPFKIIYPHFDHLKVFSSKMNEAAFCTQKSIQFLKLSMQGGFFSNLQYIRFIKAFKQSLT